MIIRIRQKTRRRMCRVGFRIPVLFSLMVSAQPGLTAEEPYNWLQLRKLNTENQQKLKQQRLDTGNPSSPALSSEPRQQNPVEPTQIHQESKIEPSGKDTFILNQSQQLDQKQLQDQQHREQTILRQRNRTRNDPVTGKRKSNAHLQRSRQQQQNQLNRMRTQSRMNSRR
jgi:hypothetical protein